MALEIRIDREACMGSGNYSFWASEDKVVLAAQGCPTQAITVLRDGQKVV